MARPTTEKICITCGKPFLPTGGRQKRCPDCKGGKPRAGRDTLTAAAQAAAEPEQAQDTLQEYIRYLNQQETELTARLEHIRIALEEAAAYDGVRHSGWRQHKENPRTGGNR